MIQLAALLGGTLAKALATIGAVGAGGAILASATTMLYGLLRRWSTSETLERGGLAALIGAPAIVALVAYGNLILKLIG